MRVTGTYERSSVSGEEVSAFLPNPLPPQGPPLDLDTEARRLLEGATEALRRLDLAVGMLPSVSWFVYAYVRKEAVLSSQIEGTQATLLDLLTFEAREDLDPEIEPDVDVEEICNYLEAVNHARAELGRSDGLPLSMRLLNECHERLLSGARGANGMPGELRKSQVWIGGTRPANAVFVPPPHHALPDLHSALERYIHSDDGLPPLVRIALIHVQFETIHPYLDGNGRIGRLLVHLLLEQYGLLGQPVLYLSLYFKRHRAEYYRRLDAVRTAGDWESWVSFFLEGTVATALDAVETASTLVTRIAADRSRLLAAKSTTVAALRLFELLPDHPVLTIPRAADLLTTSRPTASSAITLLTKAGILTETTGRKRDRIFRYEAYLERLGAGTEVGE
ncbi:MAG: Fic family protein [Acidobacteria bacterium]|nr:Fic family protein [Acidobacteriota bacterium]